MEPLPERVLFDEIDERGQRLGVPARGQPGVGQALVRREDELGDARGGRSGEPVIEQLRQGFPVHEGEGSLVALTGALVVERVGSGAALSDESLEPQDVDVVGLHGERVPGVAPQHRVSAEHPSSLRNPGLQCVLRVTR